MKRRNGATELSKIICWKCPNLHSSKYRIDVAFFSRIIMHLFITWSDIFMHFMQLKFIKWTEQVQSQAVSSTPVLDDNSMQCPDDNIQIAIPEHPRVWERLFFRQIVLDHHQERKLKLVVITHPARLRKENKVPAIINPLVPKSYLDAYN
jgi:hypothetical protein